MKIVQLANFYTPTSGGLRTCLEQIGRGYLDQGHERILIVPAEHDSDEQTPAGRRIAVESPGLPGPAGYRVLTARRRVLERLDNIRPDILEVSDKLSISWLARWARTRRVPVVLFSHERLDAILRSRVPRWLPLPALADLVNRRLSGLVEAVVVASRFSAEEFLRVGAHNVVQIPLGVDLETFRPLSTMDKQSPQDTVGLVTVGRLSTEKSPGLALDCLRVLRQSGVDAHLTIVGDGPLRTRMQRQAAGLPVRFTGHVSDRDEIAALLAGADVAISPSSAESFGLATLEALACGTPVVVPSAGAAPELVRSDGSGVICVATGAGLAAGVRELLARPVNDRRVAARSTAERFPWSATVASLLERYAEATELAAQGERPPRAATTGCGGSKLGRPARAGSRFGGSHSDGSRLTDARLARSRLGGPEPADSRFGGSKHAESKHGGSKRGGSKHAESKHGESKHGESKHGGSSQGAGGQGASGSRAGGRGVVGTDTEAGRSKDDGSGGSGSRKTRTGGLKLLSSRRGRGSAQER